MKVFINISRNTSQRYLRCILLNLTICFNVSQKAFKLLIAFNQILFKVMWILNLNTKSQWEIGRKYGEELKFHQYNLSSIGILIQLMSGNQFNMLKHKFKPLTMHFSSIFYLVIIFMMINYDFDLTEKNLLI